METWPWGLPGKSLAVMECVSSSFARRHWDNFSVSGEADGIASQAACVSLPEKAAERILQNMYPIIVCHLPTA